MKTLIALPLLALASTFVSCSDKDDPKPVPEPLNRIAKIISDNESEEYQYDESGKVTRWKYSSPTSVAQTNYTYLSDNEIKVVSMYSFPSVANSENRYIYDETLHIGRDGNVEYADGVWNMYNVTTPVAKKKYRLDFVYDSRNRLTEVKQSEWRQKGDGWEADPWTWTNTVEWNDCNPVRYTDYQGKARPNCVTEYTYFRELSAEGMPLSIPLIRAEYGPLQHRGYFGQQPVYLVSQIERTWENGINSVEKYDYNLSTSSTGSRLEGYTITASTGTSRTFHIRWE